ncbi:hypothetical protein O181_093694 [Austropuccinia psidii MF-1]|uniref:Uncharacterized protein n=1 Tax=Austropuccinia psidii MF-1 TaxID=1389203 RepID=A0A9Q3J1Q0_9BASI|nr:hypothetical protein [Austropuccinia psidii MF-1]
MENKARDADSMAAAIPWAYHLSNLKQNSQKPIPFLQTEVDALNLCPKSQLALQKSHMGPRHRDLLSCSLLSSIGQTLKRSNQLESISLSHHWLCLDSLFDGNPNTAHPQEKRSQMRKRNQACCHSYAQNKQQLWEEQQLRMSSTGNQNRRKLDLYFEDEEESQVHLLIHDLKPPFLDGCLIFTKQLEPVNPINDPTSDMAIFSKKKKEVY